MYLPWRRLLPSDISLCLVQLPGREERFLEAPHKRIEDMAEEVVAAMASLSSLRSVFFGHSMGALIALEVARRLQQGGPEQLLISACQAPRLIPLQTPISHLSDDAFVAALQQRTNGLPPELMIDRDMLSIYIGLLKADVGAVDRYVAKVGHPVSCPILALGGSSDPAVDPDALGAWTEEAGNGFDLRLFAGDHFYFSRDPRPLLSCILGRMAQEGQTQAGGLA